MKKSKGRRLKDLIENQELLILPGVYDGISAKIIQKMGFEAATVTGAGLSNSRLGRPDVGLMSLDRNVETCRVLADASELLLMADADTGYGNAVSVYYNVQAFEKAGVAGIMIEDQIWPKRCGHLDGKGVIEAEEMVEKIHAAVDAKKDPDFVIRARTDAAGVLGLDEAIRRSNLYAQAGADLLFADALLSKEDIKNFVNSVSRPVTINMGFGIRKRPTTPLISPGEMQEMGIAAVSYPRLVTSAAMQGMENGLKVLKESIETGEIIERPDLLYSFKQITDLMGLPEVKALEEKYTVKD